MKRNQIEEGRFSDGGHGLGTVTEEMVRKRAGEIAVINGRTTDTVLDSDLEEARRELLGEERLNAPESAAERLPEGQRWNPNPESAGRKTPMQPAPDEQTFAEKLVEEGVANAEHEQSIKAERNSRRRDRS